MEINGFAGPNEAMVNPAKKDATHLPSLGIFEVLIQFAKDTAKKVVNTVTKVGDECHKVINVCPLKNRLEGIAEISDCTRVSIPRTRTCVYMRERVAHD